MWLWRTPAIDFIHLFALFCLQKFREKLPSYGKKEVDFTFHAFLKQILWFSLWISVKMEFLFSQFEFFLFLLLIWSFCPQELVQLINSNRVLVVSGETGCGKTTQVTQFILDDYINRGMGSLCRVVCTQPRRISAISVCTLLVFQLWHFGLYVVVCILRKDVFT